jgi:hypothetical protein
MPRDRHPPLRDVTADTENRVSSIVACWTVFTDLLPGNALIEYVILFYSFAELKSSIHRMYAFTVNRIWYLDI